METPEQEVQQLEAQVEDNNVLTLNLTVRQLSIIMGISNDKKILNDRLEDNNKREKDAVNLILEAHNVDPLSAREVQLQDGKLIVVRNPIGKGTPKLPIKSQPKVGLPQNGLVENKK